MPMRKKKPILKVLSSFFNKVYLLPKDSLTL